MKRYGIALISFAVLLSLSLAARAQSYQRATMIASTNAGEGRCTVSMLVYGAGDMEIRGDSARVRRVSSIAPRIERFECTGPLPDYPADLQLRAIEGDGRVTLTHDLNHGGVAVVRVTSPDAREEMYTFDIFWRPQRPYYRSSEADRIAPPSPEDSVQSCRAAAENRIRNDGFRYVQFGSLSNDNRGRDDWVTGTASANGPYGSEYFTVTCSVDSGTGQLRRLDVSRR